MHALLGRVGIVLTILPAVAHATVTNQRTGVGYDSLSAALDAGRSGDTYEIDGEVKGTATVSLDSTLVPSSSGGSLVTGDGPLLTLDKDVTLVIDGVDLEMTGSHRLITALDGGNHITIEDATLDGAAQYVASEGGMIRVVSPSSFTMTDVTVLGTNGVDLASQGGAIAATGAGPMDLTDVRFEEVEASGNGGAIYAAGVALHCVRCTFDQTKGGFGGAIYFTGADLTVEQSLFCANEGSLGGAIHGQSDATIVSSLFVETEASTNGAALFANGGDWLVRNNHFVSGDVGANLDTSGTVYAFGPTDDIDVRNNLFHDNDDVALVITDAGAGQYEAEYNWFSDNGTDTDLAAPHSSNHLAADDPELVGYTRDGLCGNDQMWPTPFTSPLLDAGDPALLDPDGTVSDIGAFGGPDADSAQYGDADADGVGFFWDCDDTDSAITDRARFFPDCDGDGQGRDVAGRTQCFAPDNAPLVCILGQGGWASTRDLGPLANADCDDLRPVVYTGADETCDDLDRNCDGHPYDGAVDMRTYFLDVDRDGYGAREFQECASPVPGWVARGGDCDDSDPRVRPGALDPCGDGIDQDCSGSDGARDDRVDWFEDADGDGFGTSGGEALQTCRGDRVAGFAPNDADCDDTDPTIHPLALEVCNGVDDTCDGNVDDAGEFRRWYLDEDGDGVGGPDYVEGTCAPDASYVSAAGDCLDDDPTTQRPCEGCGCTTTSPATPWWLGLGWLGMALCRRRA